MIDADDTGSIHNCIWSMDDDEVEDYLKKCETEIDTNDNLLLCKDDDDPLSDTSFADN